MGTHLYSLHLSSFHCSFFKTVPASQQIDNVLRTTAIYETFRYLHKYLFTYMAIYEGVLKFHLMYDGIYTVGLEKKRVIWQHFRHRWERFLIWTLFLWWNPLDTSPALCHYFAACVSSFHFHTPFKVNQFMFHRPWFNQGPCIVFEKGLTFF